MRALSIAILLLQSVDGDRIRSDGTAPHGRENLEHRGAVEQSASRPEIPPIG